MMIAALTNAGLIFGEPAWLDIAAKAFDFVARSMTKADRLGHSWREEQLKFPGLASDFAAMIRAALALYEATGREAYLEQALSWQRALDRDYADAKTGTYYLTAADAEGLVIRPASTSDDATPNHNAIAAQNLIRLAALSGDDQWREKADNLIGAIAPDAVENLYMHMALFNAVDLRLRVAEIVVTGEGPRRRSAPRRRAATTGARSHRVPCRLGGRIATTPSGPRQDRRGQRTLGLCLRRRNLFSADSRSGRANRRHRQRCDILNEWSLRGTECAFMRSAGAKRGRSDHALRDRSCSRWPYGLSFLDPVGNRRSSRRVVWLYSQGQCRDRVRLYHRLGLSRRCREGRYVFCRS